MKRRDHTGERYGRLVVLGDAPDKKSKGRINRMLFCQCDCGEQHTTYLHSIRAGVATSCGCFAREESGRRNRTHGMSGAPEYNVWHSMLKRARGTCDKSRYAERGIGVCERWEKSFEAFLEDMGHRPDGHSIDRIDNNGDYCPENCRWADHKTQSRNKQETLYGTYQGVTKPLATWSEEFGIEHSALRGRIRLGWTLDRALETPYKKMKPRKNKIK